MLKILVFIYKKGYKGGNFTHVSIFSQGQKKIYKNCLINWGDHQIRLTYIWQKMRGRQGSLQVSVLERLKRHQRRRRRRRCYSSSSGQRMAKGQCRGSNQGVITELLTSVWAGTAQLPWIVQACPPARITGPPTWGLGRQGMVAPLGGDCKKLMQKHTKYILHHIIK